MEKDIDFYLAKSVEELKNVELKKEILYNANHYIFVWFCQSASEEQLKALLDDEGISLLANADRLNEKLNGLLSSGSTVNFFGNSQLCEMVLEQNALDQIYALNSSASLTLARYIYQNKREKMLEIYRNSSMENQIEILRDMVFEVEEKVNMLRQSKKEAAEFLLNRDNFDLSELSIEDIEGLAMKRVIFPPSKVTPQLIKKIATIGDVNRYRTLMNELEEENDLSAIEQERKKVYEEELATIGEDGLLEKFRKIKEKMEKGTRLSIQEIEEIGGFAGSNAVYEILFSRNPSETIKKLNDYYISNMIVDYFFEDIPTNVLKNIEVMLRYNSKNVFLSEQDRKTYEMLQSIDSLDAEQKMMIFEKLRNQNINMVSKFYDDFSKAKDTMVEQINDSILSEKNIEELYDERLSEMAGVPIYCLTGQPFKCLVRNIGVSKNTVLQENNLDFRTDGSSFSIDGSELLQVFGNCKENYTFAYSRIPPKQLVHAFPTDSFSKYIRSYENDVPENRNSTDRVMGLYTPDEFTSIGQGCTEVVISVPNRNKDNEFEQQLEKPRPFAIYCYDTIYYEDIESAKRLGIGIIVVDTRCYSIDRTQRISEHDTIGKDRKKYSYLKPHEEDERKKGR